MGTDKVQSDNCNPLSSHSCKELALELVLNCCRKGEKKRGEHGGGNGGGIGGDQMAKMKKEAKRIKGETKN